MLERWGIRLSSAGPPPHPVTDVGAAPHDRAIDLSMFDSFAEGEPGSGANAFVAKLIDLYLVESTSRIATLKEAVNERDARSLSQAAHSLKGASSAMGASGLAAICNSLETIARNSATLDEAPPLVVALEREFVRVCDALHVERRVAV
jgi:HPt (histidine-containing phosphotransfer) domain-containing protein